MPARGRSGRRARSTTHALTSLQKPESGPLRRRLQARDRRYPRGTDDGAPVRRGSPAARSTGKPNLRSET
jgi:hypothetical protein